ncbi:MAG: hypothetical protein ACRDFY_01290, partial [Candidatus Limnocylindria bacterium]
MTPKGIPPLLPRRIPLLAVLVFLLGLLAACGQDAPQLPFLPTPSPTPEQPHEVAVTVVTRGADQPLIGAEVVIDGSRTFTDQTGVATISALRGASVSVTAAGHDPAEASVTDEGELAVELRPNVVSGTVTGSQGEA